MILKDTGPHLSMLQRNTCRSKTRNHSAKRQVLFGRMKTGVKGAPLLSPPLPPKEKKRNKQTLRSQKNRNKYPKNKPSMNFSAKHDLFFLNILLFCAKKLTLRPRCQTQRKIWANRAVKSRLIEPCVKMVLCSFLQYVLLIAKPLMF